LLDQLVRERAVGDLDNEGIDGLDIHGIENISLYVTVILPGHMHS
jgi:hypothetical protein